MTELILKSFFSLIFISISLYFILSLIQKYTKFGSGKFNTKDKRDIITLNSVAYIDSGSKIVNFRCKNKNYLVLLGKNNNLMIDSYENHEL